MAGAAVAAASDFDRRRQQTSQQIEEERTRHLDELAARAAEEREVSDTFIHLFFIYFILYYFLFCFTFFLCFFFLKKGVPVGPGPRRRRKFGRTKTPHRHGTGRPKATLGRIVSTAFGRPQHVRTRTPAPCATRGRYRRGRYIFFQQSNNKIKLNCVYIFVS